MTASSPVIALALDAAQASLVDRLMDEGRMPNLAALRARGRSAELRSLPVGFLSMVWPTLFSGRQLGAHGWYFNKLWSAPDQCLRYADPSWLPIDPFWKGLGPSFRLALLDIPFSTVPGPGFEGVYLNGWQAHDDFGKLSHPRGLHRLLAKRFGRPVMRPEIFGPQDPRTLGRQRQEGIDSLHQFARIVADQLEKGSWDLLLAVFGGIHRGTHYLWSLEEAELHGIAASDRARLEGARDELYEAADRALGRVLESAPPEARILVFALHGMGPNPGWAEHFPAMVAHLHGRGEGPPPREGWIYRAKRSIPWPWIRIITRRLPARVQHALVPVWSRRMFDWSSTRFFALPVDLNGYLRVNLRGRDREGIVEPGDEYEALLDRLTKDFLALRDLRDNAPIVAGVDRVDGIVGVDARARRDLPDLIVRWTERGVRGSPGLKTPYGVLRIPGDRPLPSGRSGNHTSSGWLIAAGPGIEPGRAPEPLTSTDLTVTFLDWIGAPIPPELEGTPLDGRLALRRSGDQRSSGV